EADIAGARNGVATTTRSLRTAASFVLAPRTHVVDATASASFAGLEGSWNGILPVVPGAIWLDPELVSQHRIRVVAPVPREVAYATIATRTARLWGGAIALAKDERGFAAGEISWPDLDAPAEEPKWLTLASDPRATGAGTVGWPLHPDAGERAFRDWLLLDGMPRAEERDNARRHRARTLSAASLFAAAVLEGVLLAHGTYGRGMRSWAWLAVAIATVVFAFAALGVVAMWRTIG
ncbi:MAG TPA: hypothetical protein VJT73_02980, partial [Polyangiaceae bacterium]|nr:hypothetical protein [Polyangiaceae bacterium]